MKNIWWEKHRPKWLNEFVGQDHLRAEMEELLQNGAPMQNYLFHSKEPGTGKTTLAYIIAHNMGLQLHQFNDPTKEQRGIEFVQNDVIPLASVGQECIIFLDEADQLTDAAQSALKGVIENSPAFFILTCNDLNKVSVWLRSRCQLRQFHPIPDKAMKKRLARVASLEGATIREVDLDRIVKRHKGDLRNALGALQTLALLPEDNRASFSLSLIDGDFDVAHLLRLIVKEKAFDEAMNMIQNIDAQSVVDVVFRHGIHNPANVTAKLSLIDAAVISRRDLLMGVEDEYVKHNFVRMLYGEVP